MNCQLVTQSSALYGIIGELQSLSGEKLFVTLEHAYAEGAAWVPKLARGQMYDCVRRMSPRLGYEVFCIQNAPAFQGVPVSFIEIHKGNYNSNSEGCILLGMAVGTGMIEDSGVAFDKFMAMQSGIDVFQLKVI